MATCSSFKKRKTRTSSQDSQIDTLNNSSQYLSDDQQSCGSRCPAKQIPKPYIGFNYFQCQICPSTSTFVSYDGYNCVDRCNSDEIIDFKALNCTKSIQCTTNVYSDEQGISWCVDKCPPYLQAVSVNSQSFQSCQTCSPRQFINKLTGKYVSSCNILDPSNAKDTDNQICNFFKGTDNSCVNKCAYPKIEDTSTKTYLQDENSCKKFQIKEQNICVDSCHKYYKIEKIPRKQYQVCVLCIFSDSKGICYEKNPPDLITDFTTQQCLNQPSECKAYFIKEIYSCVNTCPLILQLKIIRLQILKFVLVTSEMEHMCTKNVQSDENNDPWCVEKYPPHLQSVSVNNQSYKSCLACQSGYFMNQFNGQCVGSQSAKCTKIKQNDLCLSQCLSGQLLQVSQSKIKLCIPINSCTVFISSYRQSCIKTCVLNEDIVSLIDQKACVICPFGLDSDGKKYLIGCKENQICDTVSKSCIQSQSCSGILSANQKRCVSQCGFPEVKPSSTAIQSAYSCKNDQFFKDGVGCIYSSSCTEYQSADKKLYQSEEINPQNKVKKNLSKVCLNLSLVILKHKLANSYKILLHLQTLLESLIYSGVQNLKSSVFDLLKQFNSCDVSTNLDHLSNKLEDYSWILLGSNTINIIPENQKQGFSFKLQFNLKDLISGSSTSLEEDITKIPTFCSTVSQLSFSSSTANPQTPVIKGQCNSTGQTYSTINAMQVTHLVYYPQCGSCSIGLTTKDIQKSGRFRNLEPGSDSQTYQLTYNINPLQKRKQFVYRLTR
ncbi:hypothetical protein ABPG72_022158 [Tetrahymena utriculariae]